MSDRGVCSHSNSKKQELLMHFYIGFFAIIDVENGEISSKKAPPAQKCRVGGELWMPFFNDSGHFSASKSNECVCRKCARSSHFLLYFLHSGAG
jgi:hypothetical protein